MAARADMSAHVALVTGGSRGIGAAVAVALAEAGADIAINYRERGADAAEAIARAGSRDRPAGHLGARRMSRRRRGGEDGRKAGRRLGPSTCSSTMPALRSTAASGPHRGRLRPTIAVNLKSAFLCTQGVLPACARAAGPHRQHIVGCGARRRIVGVHYNASKAGIKGLTRGYAARLAREGITVNAVAPSLIETEMMPARPSAAAGAARSPRPAGGSRGAVLMVLGNAYMTGQTVQLNGGLLFI